MDCRLEQKAHAGASPRETRQWSVKRETDWKQLDAVTGDLHPSRLSGLNDQDVEGLAENTAPVVHIVLVGFLLGCSFIVHE